MTNNLDNKHDEELVRELNNICDECKKEDESVLQNLISVSIANSVNSWLKRFEEIFTFKLSKNSV